MMTMQRLAEDFCKKHHDIKGLTEELDQANVLFNEAHEAKNSLYAELMGCVGENNRCRVFQVIPSEGSELLEVVVVHWWPGLSGESPVISVTLLVEVDQ